jgi:tellurite resistance protein TerC
MTIWLWVGFIMLVLALLALDLGVLNKNPHVVSTKEAIGWTVLWVSVALLFNALVFVMYEQHWLGIGRDVGHELSGQRAAIHFFTAYLVEKSLSLDNIFVIAMVFSYFQVPAQYQHRVLFWGIVGALVMRGAMIVAGIAVIERFSWLVYVFGGLLIVTAVKMLVVRHDNLHPERNPLVRVVRRLYPITSDYHGQRFFAELDGKRAATPLLLSLVLVESTDLLFAVDSIPAVFAVTLDPFIVFTSNVFAIMGLRSLYFALAAVMDRFRYMKMSLVFVLAFVGVKMILTHHHPIPAAVSLTFIVGILTVGVLASLLAGRRDTAALASPIADPAQPATTTRTVRRVFVLMAGSTLLLVGAALLLLPGPGTLVIVGGLAVLATEFVWARVWLTRVRERMRSVVKRGEKRPEGAARHER